MVICNNSVANAMPQPRGNKPQKLSEFRQCSLYPENIVHAVTLDLPIYFAAELLYWGVEKVGLADGMSLYLWFSTLGLPTRLFAPTLEVKAMKHWITSARLLRLSP